MSFFLVWFLLIKPLDSKSLLKQPSHKNSLCRIVFFNNFPVIKLSLDHSSSILWTYQNSPNSHHLMTWLMCFCHLAEIKANLQMAYCTTRNNVAGLIPEGFVLGNNVRMVYWPASPLLKLINQLQTWRTRDGLGPIKGSVLRWGQMEIYVAYIKGH